MDKYEFPIILSIYLTILILFTCSITCFDDKICAYFVKQDESVNNENSSGIEMQDL